VDPIKALSILSSFLPKGEKPSPFAKEGKKEDKKEEKKENQKRNALVVPLVLLLSALMDALLKARPVGRLCNACC
jgi:H+/gluconate symporter-like permease